MRNLTLCPRAGPCICLLRHEWGSTSCTVLPSGNRAPSLCSCDIELCTWVWQWFPWVPPQSRAVSPIDPCCLWTWFLWPRFSWSHLEEDSAGTVGMCTRLQPLESEKIQTHQCSVSCFYSQHPNRLWFHGFCSDALSFLVLWRRKTNDKEVLTFPFAFLDSLFSLSRHLKENWIRQSRHLCCWLVCWKCIFLLRKGLRR